MSTPKRRQVGAGWAPNVPLGRAPRARARIHPKSPPHTDPQANLERPNIDPACGRGGPVKAGDGKESLAATRESCRRVARHVSRRVTPSDPGGLRGCPNLPKNSQIVFEMWLRRPRFGPRSTPTRHAHRPRLAPNPSPDRPPKRPHSDSSSTTDRPRITHQTAPTQCSDVILRRVSLPGSGREQSGAHLNNELAAGTTGPRAISSSLFEPVFDVHAHPPPAP